jgi:hypothetical protein
MLTLEFEKENFKRYNNGKGYTITVDTSSERKYFAVFYKEDAKNGRFLPVITVENYNKDGSYSFGAINNVSVKSLRDINQTIEEIENYLNGYKIAKESIDEFQKAITDEVI